jgi:2-(1,2-epoxy-1,2-dihydrophenyl)acetyl-CoA isomerase
MGRKNPCPTIRFWSRFRGESPVVINRPQAFNALDLDCARRLAEAANRCSCDAGVRAVVLTGAGGKAFCAGGDVAAFAADPATVDWYLKEITGHLNLAVSRFAAMDAPVIAAVNGIAAGAGLSLAAGCDQAIAADTARFIQRLTQIGFADGARLFLSRLIGARGRWTFTSTFGVDAAAGVEWGIVNRVSRRRSEVEAGMQAAGLAAGPNRASRVRG